MKITKKKLINCAESLWKEVCRRRDGDCQALRFEENHVCSGYLQVDHCFSRMVGQLFLDPRNGTLICQGFHVRKTNKVKAADKFLDEFVRAREGEEWWAYAKAVCKSKKPHIWNLFDLDRTIISLRSLLNG